MLVCMHDKKGFAGIMLVKTNPPSVKAGYEPDDAMVENVNAPGKRSKHVTDGLGRGIKQRKGDIQALVSRRIYHTPIKVVVA